MECMSVLPLYRHLQADLGTMNVATVNPDMVIVHAYKTLLKGEVGLGAPLVPHNPRSHSEYTDDVMIVTACVKRAMTYIVDEGMIPPSGYLVTDLSSRLGRLRFTVTEQ